MKKPALAVSLLLVGGVSAEAHIRPAQKARRDSIQMPSAAFCCATRQGISGERYHNHCD
jgi:hypothetical protein